LEKYEEWFKKSAFFGAFDYHVVRERRDEERLVGIIGLVRFSMNVKTKHIGTIVSMYVDEDYRRHGVATSLINAACDEAEQMGLEQVQLSPAVNNEPAVALYQSLGFEIFGTEKEAMKVDGKYIDEYLMVKFLK